MTVNPLDENVCQTTQTNLIIGTAAHMKRNYMIFEDTSQQKTLTGKKYLKYANVLLCHSYFDFFWGMEGLTLAIYFCF